MSGAFQSQESVDKILWCFMSFFVSPCMVVVAQKKISPTISY